MSHEENGTLPAANKEAGLRAERRAGTSPSSGSREFLKVFRIE